VLQSQLLPTALAFAKEGPHLAALSELSDDLASLLHMLGTIVAKKRFQTLAGGFSRCCPTPVVRSVAVMRAAKRCQSSIRASEI